MAKSLPWLGMESSFISNTYTSLTEDCPFHLPDCCSSLSLPFIEHLTTLLAPHPALTLSIGSGTGLLEALLLHRRPTLNLKAVEVPTTNNKYMPIDKVLIVDGYRDLCGLAADASAWIFVYPRDNWLLQTYVRVFGDQRCELIIWVGPRADQLEDAFFGATWTKEIIEDCGLKDYESMALWRRLPLDKIDSRTKEDGPSV